MSGGITEKTKTFINRISLYKFSQTKTAPEGLPGLFLCMLDQRPFSLFLYNMQSKSADLTAEVDDFKITVFIISGSAVIK